MAMSLLCWLSGHVQAGEMTHFFVNPSFGGSPLNSNHLLSIAGAINTYSAPQKPTTPATTSTAPKTPTTAELFSQQVDRLVMSVLANRLVNQAFGTNDKVLPKDGSTINTGLNTITVVNSISGTAIKIVDNVTGSEATITVPQF